MEAAVFGPRVAGLLAASALRPCVLGASEREPRPAVLSVGLEAGPWAAARDSPIYAFYVVDVDAEVGRVCTVYGDHNMAV